MGPCFVVAKEKRFFTFAKTVNVQKIEIRYTTVKSVPMREYTNILIISIITALKSLISLTKIGAI